MYSKAFYGRRQQQKEVAARVILDLVLPLLPPVKRAVDIGCGVGTWLAELETRGVEVLGFDGPWVDQSQLRIAHERFRRTDLGTPISESSRFDLSISLEVAEHLPESRADVFVDNLTRLSDAVLFSAAIPGQGGTGHVNEQWPTYWIERFAARGFGLADVVRPAIWEDERMPYWYRQNTLLFVKESRLADAPAALREAVERGPVVPLRAVHPILLEEKSQGLIAGALKRAKATLAGAKSS